VYGNVLGVPYDRESKLVCIIYQIRNFIQNWFETRKRVRILSMYRSGTIQK